MKTIIFDIFGNAHFRNPEFNGAFLRTYLIPPKTAIRGWIGAILGYENDLEFEFSYSVRMIGYDTITAEASVNYSNTSTTKSRTGTSVQVKHEIVSNAHYRIFISFENFEIHKKFIVRLKSNSEFWYSYLGAKEYGYELKYVGTAIAKEFKNAKNVKIHTFVSRYDGAPYLDKKFALVEWDFHHDEQLMCMSRDKDRNFSDVHEIITSKDPRNPIFCKRIKRYWKVRGRNVCFI